MRLPSFTFRLGDSAEVLKSFPDESAHCILTSPPYFQQRDYGGKAEQLGIEGSTEEYITRLVAILREAKRVLRRDGNMLLNINDTYVGKQLLCIPHRVAMALQKDGWFLRLDGIWDKPNATPDAAKDRFMRSHEYVFLLSRRARKYFWDKEATLEPNTSTLSPAKEKLLLSGAGTVTPSGAIRCRSGGKWAELQNVRGGFFTYNPRGRNARSVFRIPTRAFFPKSVGITDVDHFAAMSPDLVEKCLLAATPAGGVCECCGTPRKRVLARTVEEDTWIPNCPCNAETIPATVLDPFGGTGTTLSVAKMLGRSGEYIDCNSDYLRLAQARVQHSR